MGGSVAAGRRGAGGFLGFVEDVASDERDFEQDEGLQRIAHAADAAVHVARSHRVGDE